MGADIGAEHIQEVFENGLEVENLTIEIIWILCSFNLCAVNSTNWSSHFLKRFFTQLFLLSNDDQITWNLRYEKIKL